MSETDVQFRPVPGLPGYSIAENGFLLKDGYAINYANPNDVVLFIDGEPVRTSIIELTSAAFPKSVIDKSPLVWVTVTEFPDYEIHAHGTIRNKTTGYVLQRHRGKDYEYQDCVWMWRNGVRECRTVDSLLRTAFEVTMLEEDPYARSLDV